MGTKEQIDDGLQALARMIPGIESYQNKETLRETDKQLRQTFGDRLDALAKTLNRTVYQIQREGRLDHIDLLGRLERRLHGAADAIRFANYGYSGFFAPIKVDKGKIQQLYDHDIGLADDVSAVQAQVRMLETTHTGGVQRESLAPLEAAISSLENKVQKRIALFRSDDPL